VSSSAGPTENSDGPTENSEKDGLTENSDKGGPPEISEEGGSLVGSADENCATVRHASDSMGGTSKATEAAGAQSAGSTEDAALVGLVPAGVDDGKSAPAPHAPSPARSIPQAETGQEAEGNSKISAPSRGCDEETGLVTSRDAETGLVTSEETGLVTSDDDMTCEDAERLLRQALGAATDTSSAAQASGDAAASPSTTGGSTASRARDASSSLPCAAESAPKHASGDSGGTGSPASAETLQPSASGAATTGAGLASAPADACLAVTVPQKADI